VRKSSSKKNAPGRDEPPSYVFRFVLN
jgi:hypothetical protein